MISCVTSNLEGKWGKVVQFPVGSLVAPRGPLKGNPSASRGSEYLKAEVPPEGGVTFGTAHRAFGYRDSSISSAHSGQMEEGRCDSAENRSADSPRATSSERRHLDGHVTKPGGTIAATRGVHTWNDAAATPQDCPKSRRRTSGLPPEEEFPTVLPHREKKMV